MGLVVLSRSPVLSLRAAKKVQTSALLLCSTLICAEIQTCQLRRFFSFDSLAGYKNLKIFAHAGGGNQMFELERDFRALLRQAAFLKGVRKLSGLTDA
jgi:hypothetical protein